MILIGNDLVPFCDCGFCSGDYGIVVLASSVCPLMDEDKGHVMLPDGRDWLWGKLGLALVDGDVLVNL